MRPARPPLLILLVYSGVSSAQPVPEPRPIGLTLDEVRGLSHEALWAHVNTLMDRGYHGVRGRVNGRGLEVTYRSPQGPAGPGVCEATEVTYVWVAETRLPPGGDSVIPVPPPDAGTAPLRLNRHYVDRVFHLLAQRRALSSPRRTERGCAQLDRSTEFVSADSPDAFRRASAVLAALHRRLSREPGSIAIECGGVPDCVDRVRRTTINELESIVACAEWWGGAAIPNCVRFQFATELGVTMARTEGFEVETIDSEGPPRVRRLRWRPWMVIS